ncbi:hypothetical protein H9Q73_007961 [Fusarium xylarioides]|nr:hypothetical protein H9Q73_007961 [Fusarium xylarioides]
MSAKDRHEAGAALLSLAWMGHTLIHFGRDLRQATTGVDSFAEFYKLNQGGALWLLRLDAELPFYDQLNSDRDAMTRA